MLSVSCLTDLLASDVPQLWKCAKNFFWGGNNCKIVSCGCFRWLLTLILRPDLWTCLRVWEELPGQHMCCQWLSFTCRGCEYNNRSYGSSNHFRTKTKAHGIFFNYRLWALSFKLTMCIVEPAHHQPRPCITPGSKIFDMKTGGLLSGRQKLIAQGIFPRQPASFELDHLEGDLAGNAFCAPAFLAVLLSGMIALGSWHVPALSALLLQHRTNVWNLAVYRDKF